MPKIEAKVIEGKQTIKMTILAEILNDKKQWYFLAIKIISGFSTFVLTDQPKRKPFQQGECLKI